MTKPSEAR